MYWRLSEEERSLLAKLSADYQDTVLSFLKNNPPRDYLPPAQLTNELFHEICDAEVRDYPYLDVDTKYCKIIKDIVKNDFTLYALLHCLVLFDPSDEKVIDRQLISSIRDKYVILLRHYLESVYSYNHSEKYLIALLDKLLFQRNMHLENKPLYKKFFPQAPNQLILEVWDIDH
nr:hypothetical protein BaRGS_011257 [Batillaria attramentaria]